MVASHISVIYIHIWVSLIYDAITKQLVSSSNDTGSLSSAVYTVKM